MTNNMNFSNISANTKKIIEEWIDLFCKKTGMPSVDYELVERVGEQILLIYLSNPTERYYQLLNEIDNIVMQNSLFPIRVTLKKRSPVNYLQSKEVQYLIKEISEGLTVNRYSFGNDYFKRYIQSGHGAEQIIVSDNNIAVFGRRGSGKSSLLLFDMHTREVNKRPYAWIDMQAYPQRADEGVILDVLYEVLDQTKMLGVAQDDLHFLLNRIRKIDDSNRIDPESIKALFPKIKRYLQEINKATKTFVIYLDDFHLISTELQPKLLTALYSFSRGNRVYIKLSAIEAFSNLWNPQTRDGFEIPHDAQSLHLDYNLTKATKAREHIVNILDMHSIYCGLPSVRVLCNDDYVLTRLVWVSAGIPRDALSIFSKALTKSANQKRKQLAVSDVNSAASDRVKDKLRDIKVDSSNSEPRLTRLLQKIRTTCIKDNKLNAFLVEIDNDSEFYQNVMDLVGLRLLHVINEGITPQDAGRKFVALILDYGFYISVRSGRSVKLFNREMKLPTYKELRALPVISA